MAEVKSRVEEILWRSRIESSSKRSKPEGIVIVRDKNPEGAEWIQLANDPRPEDKSPLTLVVKQEKKVIFEFSCITIEN